MTTSSPASRARAAAAASTTLSRADARAIALRAQGFSDAPPRGVVDRRHMRRVMARVHVLQIGSISVLVRSHYLPLSSRLGPYAGDVLDRAAHRHRELF